MLLRLVTRLIISFSVVGALYAVEFNHMLESSSAGDLGASVNAPSIMDALNEYHVVADKLEEVSQMLSH